MEKVKKTPIIDISQWNLEHIDRLKDSLEKVVCNTVNEALSYAVTYKAEVRFPYDWDCGDTPGDGNGNPLPKDPMTIYISLPLSGDEYQTPEWKLSLRESIKNSIALHVRQDGKIHVNEDKVYGIIKIRDGLRELAKLIDDVIIC